MKGKLILSAGPGWKISIVNQEIDLKSKNDETVIVAVLSPEKNATNAILSAVAEISGEKYSENVRRIEYDHIPSIVHIAKAETKLLLFQTKIGMKKIGYIPGAGDEVASCLKQMGYQVTILDEELLKQDLGQYQAIITGIRAFNTNDKLVNQKARLLNYVKQGGNLIVQYNTNSRVGPLQTSFGPYPFTISRDRVTDENAKVNFSIPAHPALNAPNKISEKDFEGWVQERGVYFATELDKSYASPLLMNDAKEKEHGGSLIIAGYGSGNFVYTGLAFFRQLPAGVEGAYKLLSNLISLPPNK